MEHWDVVRLRRMVRRYRTDPVDPAALERIIEAAHRGPSAGNAQGVSKADWVTRGYAPWLSAAPAHLVLCVEPDTYRARYSEPDKDPSALDIPWWWVDGGAALMLILQAAVDEGLTAGFLGAHAAPGIEALLGIPAGVEVAGIVTVGHPLPEEPTSSVQRGRRPTDEVTHRERWGA